MLILQMYFMNFGWPKYLGFDYGCGLYDTIRATHRFCSTTITQLWLLVVIVIDKFHSITHKDERFPNESERKRENECMCVCV